METRNLVAFALAIFCVAIVLRIAVIVIGETYSSPRFFELEKIAISLIDTGQYGNAIGPSSGPTAYFTPIYPIILSGVYKIFGSDSAGEFVRQSLNSTFMSLQYALLPFIARAVGISACFGLFAGLLGAIVPFHFWTELRGQESPLAAVSLVCLSLLFLNFNNQSTHTTRSVSILGFSWGLGVLVAPSLLPVLCGFFVLRFLKNRKQGLHCFFREVAITGLVMVLVIFPWGFRNYLQLGEFIATRSSLGIVLNLSNNDSAAAAWFENTAGRTEGGDPWHSPSERKKYIHMGEVAYTQEKMESAIKWIRSNPRRFLALTAERSLYFWFPKMERPGHSEVLWLISTLSIVGLIRLIIIRHPSAYFFLAIWVTFPAVYYFTQFVGRYRIIILWTFLITAVVAIQWLLKFIEDVYRRRAT